MFLPQKCNMGVSPLHARDFCPLFGSKLHLCCCPISPSLGTPHTLVLLCFKGHHCQFSSSEFRNPHVFSRYDSQNWCEQKNVRFIHFLLMHSCDKYDFVNDNCLIPNNYVLQLAIRTFESANSLIIFPSEGRKRTGAGDFH